MATPIGSEFPSLGFISPRMKEQLRISKTQIYGSDRRNGTSLGSHESSLPRTLEDALRPSSRAIVVTETFRPFKVCDVNKAWEDLCGYSYVESKGKSLGDLLKGPETDPLAVTSMVNQLLQGEDATIVLTNYTKTGRRFRNRLQVGPLYNEQGDIINFVGVLQEIRM